VSRGIKALALVAVVVVAVVLGFHFLRGDDAGPSASRGTDASSGTDVVPPVPDDAPVDGMYVLSTVDSSGEVDVKTWIRTTTPISELDLTTTDPDLAPGGVESLGVQVRSFAGKVLARRASVGTNPQKLELREPATELYLTYTIDGAMSDASETVQDRSLARVLGMDVSYAGDPGRVRRVVEGPGPILSMACITVKDDEDFNASPRPCGTATDDGGWSVDLKGVHTTDRLLASLSLGS